MASVPSEAGPTRRTLPRTRLAVSRVCSDELTGAVHGVQGVETALLRHDTAVLALSDVRSRLLVAWRTRAGRPWAPLSALAVVVSAEHAATDRPVSVDADAASADDARTRLLATSARRFSTSTAASTPARRSVDPARHQHAARSDRGRGPLVAPLCAHSRLQFFLALARLELDPSADDAGAA